MLLGLNATCLVCMCYLWVSLNCVLVHADRKPAQRTFVRLHSAPLTTLLIATYVPSDGCPGKVQSMHASVGLL